MRAMILAVAVAFALPADAKTYHRSREVTKAFQRSHPCPSTGRTAGGCSGYIKDHRIPLVCGGADSVSNLNWQPVAEARAKDKWERIGCSKGRRT